MQQCKFISKKELRTLLNISASTLNTYLNVRYYIELQELGYKKTAQLLSPKIIKHLQNKLDFEVN